MSRLWVKSGGLFCASAVLSLCCCVTALAAKQEKTSSIDATIVQDLDYGVVLFNFFQGNYFDSAVELMVARDLGRIPHHRDEADLLLGGLYLSYGLHNEAEVLFNRLVERGASPEVRDKTWYSLGKIRYQKGLYDDSIRALEQIEGTLERSEMRDAQHLLANLLMARGDHEQATKILQKLPQFTEDALFADYNLGVALFRAGREIEGAEYLSEVGRVTSSRPEVQALRDKANLALGYAMLGQEEHVKARAFFQKVRLQGPFSNKALLGFGWAHAMQNDYDAALTSWLELRSRKRTDPAVYESLIGVGYALEKLKAYPQALQSYKEAIQLYIDEIARLDHAINEVKSGKLMEQLVAQALGDRIEEMQNQGVWGEVPETRYITAIVSSHQFFDAVRTLRDLRRLRENLNKWESNIPVYEHMLQLRRQAYEERLPKLMPDKGIYRLAAFKDERDLYEEEYKRIVQQHDIVALADPKESSLLARLDDMKVSLVRVSQQMKRDELESYQFKYNLYRGLLEWEISTTYAGRLWKIRKGINELNREIQKTEDQQNRIQAARKVAPGGFQGYAKEISSMKARINRLQKQLETVYELQKQQVQNQIVDEFGWLRDRLSEYLDRARFSVARLQDLSTNR